MTDPVTDLDTFKSFIRDRAIETWVQRQSPYYLSFVATDLRKQEIDYRQFVGPLRLSQWAASNDVPGTVLVAHPTQRARIGFVPEDSGFKFDIEDTNSHADSRPRGTSSRGRVLIQFVQSLTDLPDDALMNFTVPAKTLIALLKN